MDTTGDEDPIQEVAPNHEIHQQQRLSGRKRGPDSTAAGTHTMPRTRSQRQTERATMDDVGVLRIAQLGIDVTASPTGPTQRSPHLQTHV